MPLAKETIGSKPTNAGWYSGKAYKQGITTANYDDNIYDFGFKPEMIYIENVSGSDNLEVSFYHGLEAESGQANIQTVSGIESVVDPISSRLYRKRNHQYVAIRSTTPVIFRLEAW